MKSWISFVFTNQTYGFRKMPDKSIVVDQKEAEMIRKIFNLSANGYGTHCSAEILYQQGYRNRKGKRLSPSLIRNIIRNPIYKGTVVQNRMHYDFESKQLCKNPPSEWLFHENAVPSIIDADLFERANRGLDERKQEGNRDGAYVKGNSPGKYDLSGRLLCGMCGSPFYRTVRRRKTGKVTEWKCSNYLQNGRQEPQLRRDRIRKVEKNRSDEDTGCDNVHLDERKLHAALEQVCHQKDQKIEVRKDVLLKETLVILRKALNDDNVLLKKEGLEVALDKIIQQKNTLLEKLLEGIITDADFKLKNEELESRKTEMEEKLKFLEDDILQNTRLESRIEAIREKLEDGIIEQAQMADMIKNISKIEVFPTYLDVYFDSRTLLGLSSENLSSTVRSKTDTLTAIRMEQTCSTSHRPMI